MGSVLGDTSVKNRLISWDSVISSGSAPIMTWSSKEAVPFANVNWIICSELSGNDCAEIRW